jgi:hypothetical protein
MSSEHDFSLEQAIKCRGMMHRWDDIVPLVKRRSMLSQTQESRCDRCGSLKIESFNVYGQVEIRHYELSEVYKMVTGISRADARAVAMGHMKLYDIPAV